MASILVVEDDDSVREAVSMALEGDGHRVHVARTGDEGLAQWRAHRPDLVLLDVMLPGTDGFDVCRAIRNSSEVPVIMLTAKSDPIDVVVGLEAGADDYVVKPFLPRVLGARIKAVLRRSQRTGAEQVHIFGDLTVDVAGLAVTRSGEELHLSPTELKVLLELVAHPGQVLTRQQLLERVWEYSYLGDSRLVDVCIQRLRAKVEPDPARPVFIQTVRGAGYKLVPPG